MLNRILNIVNSSAISSASAAYALQSLTAPKPATPVVAITTTATTPSVNEDEKPETGRREAKLIMVTPDNNNKFYDMRENTDGTFSVTYGRVGARGAEARYAMREWDTKIREKTRKGYKDQTHLFAVASAQPEQQIDGINCLIVKQLIQDLMRYAKQSISHNYVVTADKVTRQQVAEAQLLLDNLVKMSKKDMDITAFNKALIDLFSVIPRRMKNVKEHLVENAKDLKTIGEKLAEEQDTLDVMRGQVEMNEQQKATGKEQEIKPLNILDTMGWAVENVEDNTVIQMIKKMMGDDKGKFSRAFQFNNSHTNNNFNQFINKVPNKKTHLFWHGSRNENWFSILKTGLVLRPASAVITGKMFGYGLYFADKCRKSLNYSSLSGSYWSGGNSKKAYLAIYEVHTGNQLKIKHHEPYCGLLTESRLKDKGKQYDSVFAEGGADLINNEFIVYNENQCTVKYLVEVTC
jgi:poly [ADP-ribose] polymerase 2/3/4